jgi:hypothetical protein
MSWNLPDVVNGMEFLLIDLNNHSTLEYKKKCHIRTAASQYKCCGKESLHTCRLVRRHI